MKDKRPVNLDIASIHLPLAAYASILHRISGIIVFVGIALLLWVLQTSLSGPEGFASVQTAAASFLCRFLVWVTLSALVYHIIAGCRHLLMDVGIGESLEGGAFAAKVVLVLSTVLIVLLGVCLLW